MYTSFVTEIYFLFINPTIVIGDNQLKKSAFIKIDQLILMKIICLPLVE